MPCALVSMDSEFIIIEWFNPPTQHRFHRDNVVDIHKILQPGEDAIAA